MPRSPLLMLLGACSVGCPAPREPGPEHPALPSTVVAIAPAPAVASERAEQDVASIVGMLHRGGSHVCDAGDPPERGRWVDLHPTVGFVPLIAGGAALSAAERLQGQIVIAEGRVREGRPATIPPGTARCSFPIQMRSDWVQSVEGVRVKRQQAPLAAFAVSKLSVFHGLTATRSGSELSVKLENRLGRSLRAPVVLRAHYEGCYGKPGTSSRERRAEQGLAPGAVLEARLPVFEDLPDTARGRRQHLISSIEIAASGDRIWFDLDVELHRLGVTATCSELGANTK
jgi:hypothetical protein